MTDLITPDGRPHVDAAGETDVPDPSIASRTTAAGRHRARHHPARWIGVATGVVAAFVLFALAVAPPSTYSEVNTPLLGHRAPAISGTTITGETFNLGALRGHFVVVDFIASWCVPCRTEESQLVTFAEQQRNGAKLVGIIFEDTVAGARSLLGPWVGLYPVLADPGGTDALDYGVFNPPSKYVIDPRGRAVAKVIGAVTATELDAIIAKAKRGAL
jgi:cytochrome c biogenesis protein CcmG/thiol:disulfide interchange protein DsbE